MKIVCDACQAKYSIADDKIQGKAFKIRCKKCNHIIVVKTSGEATAAPVSVEKSKSAALPVAGQVVWHIVVDGDQVGPLTDTEVKDRLRQGQINSDTLVWKEGFADWVKLSTVTELAGTGAKAAQSAAQSAAGKPSARESFRAESPSQAMAAGADAGSDADVFGAATVITPAGTTDLFAAAMSPSAVPSLVSPAPSSPFLFGGSSEKAPEPVVAKSHGNGAGSGHLTGQRNENSVLFSLSNLEALAVPTQSAGIRAPSSTTTTEGSGLIDIRSMAAMTLNDGGGHEGRRSSDSLPTFSTPQFSPVAPVLLPMSSSGPPKWVYPVLALLAVGVLVLGYGIFKVVTAPPPGMPPVIAVPAPVSPAPVTTPVVAHPAQVAAPAGEAAKPSNPEDKPAAAEEKPADKGKSSSSSKGEKGHRKGSEQASSSKGGSDTKKPSETAAPASSHTSESATAAKPTGKKGSKSLDDLLGEVGNKKAGGDDAGKPKPAAVNLISLTQSDIVNAMKAVQPKVQACANQFKVPGTAMATISVATGGKVASATVTGKFAATPTGTCVEAASKSAKFPPCNSMTFPWPFTLSPR